MVLKNGRGSIVCHERLSRIVRIYTSPAWLLFHACISLSLSDILFVGSRGKELERVATADES